MIEIVPKPTPKLPPWLNFLFYFSIFFLISVIFSYFLLGYFKNQAQKEVQKYEKLLALEGVFPAEITLLEKKLKVLERKIKDFSFLIKEHRFSSKIFPLLQELCHPQVFFSSISFNLAEQKITLNGQAKDFSVFKAQIITFKNEKRIRDFHSTGFSIGEGGIILFDASFLVDPQIFK
ncbi:MAG: hypothetical protein DDT33_01210 [Firmicutes bacterium]|nr:hypothetical protein [Bacillota bacterium]